MHFGENQLSRSLIGLSPLPTTHPPGFQPWWVRSSTRSYPRFNLAMGRSLRFGSRTRDSNALFGLAFATATPPGLTSPHATNSQAHSSKGTPSPRPHKEAKAPTDCKHTVSGTISLPSRGTFHHSLTVLSAIGHQGVFSLTRWSCRIHTRFHEPRATWEHPQKATPFRLRGSHPLRRAIQCPSTTTRLYHSSTPRQRSQKAPTTPDTQRLPALTRARFSLIRFRSPLLTESQLFSLPAGTEMFHFPAFPPHTLYIRARVTGHISSRVTPFGHPRIKARLPAPRGLSQAPTSFIGSWYQGIHRMLLQTYPTQSTPASPQRNRPHRSCMFNLIAEIKDARVHYTVLKQQPDQPRTRRPPQHQREPAHGPRRS
jgi:hypothetical protein